MKLHGISLVIGSWGFLSGWLRMSDFYGDGCLCIGGVAVGLVCCRRLR